MYVSAGAFPNFLASLPELESSKSHQRKEGVLPAILWNSSSEFPILNLLCSFDLFEPSCQLPGRVQVMIKSDRLGKGVSRCVPSTWQSLLPNLGITMRQWETPTLGEPLADGACQQVTSGLETQPLRTLHWFFSI